MLIREMICSDIKSVRLIASDTWRVTYSTFIPEEIQAQVLKDAYSNEEMDHRFKSSLNLIAEKNEEIFGYAFFSGNLSDKDIFLESLYIHPDHQGKGIGKQLMLTGLARFKEPTTLSLTVYKGNPNISFYEKEGFKIIKEITGEFYGHPVVFIMMKKNLLNTN
ncbi:GNAT family N-acetyltransferase [Gottfriedia acidiceleris]|uniref:GNAT family N-acetyltransferase n=1 Tax=Gottfriedia acidiceleris TaxID=371036 RepID=UPI00101DC524|nr:GNAT family N-acetyltransferase [Gottfriedia acidiceleris]